MIWLLLSVLCSVAIAHLLRLFTLRGGPILVIFLGNYALATLFSFVQSHGAVRAPLFDAWLGAACGVFLLANFLLYRACIQRNGISLSVGVMRSSVLIPVLVALVVFGERIGMANYAGIAVVVLAFALLARGQQMRHLQWLLALFAVSGFTELFYKLYSEFGTGRESVFLFYAFGVAAAANIALLAYQWHAGGWRPGRRDIAWLGAGVALGVPNQLTALFFMFSLRTVPAAIAYPLLAASVVLGGIVVDWLLWKARFNRGQLALYGCIIVGIVLLNLRT